jgi:ferritin
MEIKKFGRDEKVEATQKNEGGVVTPKKLSNESISILSDRLKDEYTAHYFYRNAANWCRNMNYKKAAEFFENEANYELEHAKGLQEYMDDFNVLPQMPKTETSFSFGTLVDIINQAYEMEYSLMESYNKSSSEIFTSDLTTFDFLQGFRTGQKEAVIEYSDLLNAIVLIDHTNKFEVLYFEQTYF